METTVVLLRLGQYIGAVLLFGVPLFFAFRMPMSDAAADRWPRTTLLVAAVATALAALAHLVVQTAIMAGSLSEALKPASLSYVAFGTALGVGFLVRAGAALLAAILLVSLKPGRGGWIALTIVGAEVSASLAWTGHGAATEGAGRWPHLIADVVHALAAGLWLGSLFALFLMLRARHGHAAGAPVTHAALEGFAGLGTLAVVLLTITGLVNSGYLIGLSRLGSLVTTSYGVLLVLKLALFAGMLALAASNRFVLTPQLGSALEDEQTRPLALRRLRRSLALETVLAALLLLVVAIMGTQAPPAAMM
jgi:putative copper resistance protein D